MIQDVNDLVKEIDYNERIKDIDWGYMFYTSDCHKFANDILDPKIKNKNLLMNLIFPDLKITVI